MQIPASPFAAPTQRTDWHETLPWLCLGLLAGISFVVQPAKFLTPGLTREQLVSVGSTLFHVSHALQLFLVLFCAALLPQRTHQPALAWACVAILGAALTTQMLVLMPALDARLDLLRAGRDPGPGMQHPIYVALEFLKMGALIVLGRQARRAMPTTTPGGSL